MRGALDCFFDPGSIAVVGASEDPSRIGGRTIFNIRRGGFAGAIYPINPNRASVQGIPAFASLLDVPAPSTPWSSRCRESMSCPRWSTPRCGGVRGAVIFSAGFNEAGPEGEARQRRLDAIVAHSGMRVIGPNCLGVFSARNGAWLSFTTQFQDRVDGPSIGMVSQSGGSAAHILKLAQSRGLAVGTFVTTGNEADVEFGEALHALAEDPDTAVIAAYIEGVRNRASLLAGLEAARRARKPVVTLKVGRTRAGAQAAASHTASLAGEDRVYDAIFQAYGVHRARSTEELLDVVYAATAGGARLPRGDRLGVVTISGGMGAQIADEAAEAGLGLPDTPAETQLRLKALAPPGSPRNPVDITAQLSTDPHLLGSSMREMLASGTYDMLFAFFGVYAGVPALAEPILADLRRLREDYPEIPMAVGVVCPPEEAGRYADAGLLAFEEPARALRALAALARLEAAFDRAPADVAIRAMPPIPAGTRHDEASAKRLLAAIGIAAPAERLALDAAGAARAAEALRMPVALKIVLARHPPQERHRRRPARAGVSRAGRGGRRRDAGDGREDGPRRGAGRAAGVRDGARGSRADPRRATRSAVRPAGHGRAGRSRRRAVRRRRDPPRPGRRARRGGDVARASQLRVARRLSRRRPGRHRRRRRGDQRALASRRGECRDARHDRGQSAARAARGRGRACTRRRHRNPARRGMSGHPAVTTVRHGPVALILADNPPVNAIGHAVRAGLSDAIEDASRDAQVEAVVIACRGRTFFAGADIAEFGRPRQAPLLPDVCDAIEGCAKPVVAAIHGTALGGGMEIALACHYRIATPDAALGLPEVKLGIFPGAGGGNRLARLIGAEEALRIVLSGDRIAAARAHELGIVDVLASGALEASALAYAQRLLAARAGPRATRALEGRLAASRADIAAFDRLAAELTRRSAGQHAPAACVASIRRALTMAFDAAIAADRRANAELMAGDQSKALRHVFFAERQAAKLPFEAEPRRVDRVAILGAGTMGGGIAMSFAAAGVPVVLIDATREAAERGVERVRATYATSVKRGSIAQREVDRRMALIRPSGDRLDAADADLVIEAVFEDLALKQQIFADLERICAATRCSPPTPRRSTWMRSRRRWRGPGASSECISSRRPT
ncbi:MAG: enoyl-CoA hydratase-related protein [Sphingomonas sp.]